MLVPRGYACGVTLASSALGRGFRLKPGNIGVYSISVHSTPTRPYSSKPVNSSRRRANATSVYKEFAYYVSRDVQVRTYLALSAVALLKTASRISRNN